MDSFVRCKAYECSRLTMVLVVCIGYNYTNIAVQSEH